MYCNLTVQLKLSQVVIMLATRRPGGTPMRVKHYESSIDSSCITASRHFEVVAFIGRDINIETKPHLRSAHG